MTSAGLVFVGLASFAMLVLPRAYAPVSLLVGVCYMTLGQQLEVASLSFPVVRILIAVGAIRILVRGEWRGGSPVRADAAMLLCVLSAALASPFHSNPVVSFGFLFNAGGVYLLMRAWCRSLDDVTVVARSMAFVLAPVAAAMLSEALTSHNPFAAFGRVGELSQLREGRVRAQGPFTHPILAGTVGAVCVPLMVGIYRLAPGTAITGLLAATTMVVASASSGPILSTVAGLTAVCMWPLRHRMRTVRWLLLSGYVILDLVMEAPAYFLVARIDLAGGSTGWHRAQLIRSALGHIDEWWLWGTDHTRHWMPTGVTWSPDHTDITNYYLYLGTLGGLPLMGAFILVLTFTYSAVGRLVRSEAVLGNQKFMVWCLGGSLFAHTVTALSVSYFDQSFVFLYVTITLIVSAQAWSQSLATSRGSVTALGRAARGLRRRGRQSGLAHPRVPASPRQPALSVRRRLRRVALGAGRSVGQAPLSPTEVGSSDRTDLKRVPTHREPGGR